MNAATEPPVVDLIWVARCAHRLRQHWPHAELVSLEEAAADLWRDASLGGLPPEQAAECWLAPLTSAPEPERRRHA